MRKNPFCLNCGTSLKGKPSPSKTCSRECNGALQRKLYLERWKKGEIDGSTADGELSTVVRNYLLLEANHTCSCGWGEKNPVTGKVPLTINHKDGNARNHSPSNLEVLCPNCHSLTPNYGNLNRGRGKRTKRHATLVQQ